MESKGRLPIRNQVTMELNINIDNPESVLEVVSAIICASHVQFITEQSELHTPNVHRWMVSYRILKWSTIITEEMRMF
jgi:hypothetical protein